MVRAGVYLRRRESRRAATPRLARAKVEGSGTSITPWIGRNGSEPPPPWPLWGAASTSARLFHSPLAPMAEHGKADFRLAMSPIAGELARLDAGGKLFLHKRQEKRAAQFPEPLPTQP
jgi:hypothetical protein